MLSVCGFASITVLTETLKGINLLMKRQFVITPTIWRTEIPALPDSWVTNTPPVKMLYP